MVWEAMMDIKERLDKLREFAAENLFLSRRQLAAVFLLLFFMVTGSSLIYWQSRPKKVEYVKAKKAAPVKSLAKRGIADKLVKVHVAGAVNAPGVYDLKAGRRVVDAIAAAGGQRADADLDALNLAAKIGDGEKILVPVRAGTATPSTAIVATGADMRTKVAINSATSEQLQRLDGVGPVLARRIISYRSAHGTFKSLTELRKVKGIGVKKYAGLKEQVSLY